MPPLPTPLQCTIAVLGDTSSGKSTLVSLLTDSIPAASHYTPTTTIKQTLHPLNAALDLMFVEVPSEYLDTSPHKLHQICQNAHFCVLIYDTTRMASWVLCKERYFGLLENDAGKVLLIGTKLDLEQDREVPLETIEAFTRNQGIFWMELTRLGQNVALTKSILNIRANHWTETVQESEKVLSSLERSPVQQRRSHAKEQNVAPPSVNSDDATSPQNLETDFTVPLHHDDSSFYASYETPTRRDDSWEQEHHYSTPTQGINDIRSLGTDLERFISDYSTSAQKSKREHPASFVDRRPAEDPQQYMASPRRPPAPEQHPLHQPQAAMPDSESRLISPAASYTKRSLMHPSSQPQQHQEYSPAPGVQNSYHTPLYAQHDYNQHVSDEAIFASPTSPTKYSMDDEFLSPQNQYVPSHYDKISLDISQALQQPPPPPSHTTPNQKAYIKSFQESNDGNLIPIFGIDLQHDSPSKRHTAQVTTPSPRRITSKEQPKIFLDINIGDGRTGQLAISPGDNLYQMSQMFVKAFNLNNAYVPYLAHLLRNATARYLKKQKQKNKVKRTLTPVSEGGFQAFHFETEARARIKKSRQPIVKMEFELPGGRSGTVLVRKGDNPQTLAKNFVHTYGLKESMIDSVAAKIHHQLYNYYSNESTEDGTLVQNQKARPRAHIDMHMEQTPLAEHREAKKQGSGGGSSRKRQQPSGGADGTTASKRSVPPKILFNMEVELNAEDRVTFPVPVNANPKELAEEFCAQHNLSKKHRRILQSLIERNVENFTRSQAR